VNPQAHQASGKFYAMFCLRMPGKREYSIQTVYVVFPDKAELDHFQESIAMIQKRSHKINYNQFLTHSITGQPVPNYFKM